MSKSVKKVRAMNDFVAAVRLAHKHLKESGESLGAQVDLSRALYVFDNGSKPGDADRYFRGREDLLRALDALIEDARQADKEAQS